MKGNFTDRKDALRALRWDRAKKNKVLWGLFVLAFVLSFLCPILVNYIFCDIFYPTENAILNGLANISFGYFSGFLVYLFSSFLPESKRDIEIIDSIYFKLYNISMILEEIEKDFLPENVNSTPSTINLKLCNYIIKNGNVEHFITTDDLPSTICIDKIHFKALELRLTLLNEEIEKLVTSYRRELKSDEIQHLLSLAGLEKLLMKIVENDNCSINKDYLFIFIMDYINNILLFYRSVCPPYMRYKYCEYNIPHYNK